MDSATTDTAIVPPLKTQDENPSGDTGDNCPVCFDAIGTRGMVRTACGHAFCFGCFESFIVRSNSCPLCRTKVMGENSALDKCIRPSGNAALRGLAASSATPRARQAAEAAERRARDERFRNDPGSGRAWCVRCSTKILINRDGTLRRHSPCGPGMAPYNHTPSVLSLQ